MKYGENESAMKKICMFVLLSFPALYADTGNWSCWRGPNRDGKSPATDLLKEWPQGGPDLLWSLDNLGDGFSTVSIADKVIYTSGDVDGNLILYAVNMNGSIKWKTPVDEAWIKNFPGARATPTIDKDKIYILSGHGKILCLHTDDGEKIWFKDLRALGGKSGGWGYSESVLIHGDKAVVKAGGNHFMIAFDKNSGDIQWKSEGFKAGPEYSSCVPFTFQNVPLIMTGSRSGIVCVAAHSGKIVWSNDWCAGNTANCPDPVYSDGLVFWSNGYGKGGICLRMEISDGEFVAREAWKTKDLICHHGGYIIHKGYIYGNHNNGWTCLDLKTGKVIWKKKAIGKGSICFADEMLYLFNEKGEAALATCSPEGIEIKGAFKVEGTHRSWAHPVVIGGRLYLRYANNLYCFDIKARKELAKK